MSVDRLFVYGILRGTVAGAERAELPGYKKIYRGHATIKKDPLGVVEGEVFDVKSFGRYDLIEGVANNYYHRFKTTVYNVEREDYEEAWVYQQLDDK